MPRWSRALALAFALSACTRVGFDAATSDGPIVTADRGANDQTTLDGSGSGRFVLPATCTAPSWDSSGSVIRVSPSDVDNLTQICTDAPASSTILFADGVYDVPDPLALPQPGVVVRSASGNRDGVTIRAQLRGFARLTIFASTVAIADLTLADNAGDGKAQSQPNCRTTAICCICSAAESSTSTGGRSESGV